MGSGISSFGCDSLQLCQDRMAICNSPSLEKWNFFLELWNVCIFMVSFQTVFFFFDVTKVGILTTYAPTVNSSWEEVLSVEISLFFILN